MKSSKKTEILHCSPFNQVRYGKEYGTCYSQQNLIDIANEYNKLSQHKINIHQSHEQLHTDLEKAFQKICKDELCWVNNDIINNPELRNKVTNAFRPPKPRSWYDDKNTWLNTYDIVFVLEQYEKLYQDFKLMGVYPIDFALNDEDDRCIGDELCDFDIKKLKAQEKSQFGIVLNLDYHDEPGSHWVSLFCNLNPKKKNYGIFYYDSVANPPPDEVIEFMDLIKTQVNNKKFKVKSNKIQKQFGNFDCGMFCIIFMTQILKEQFSFEFICKHMHTDKEINRLRDVIYSPSKSSS